MGMKADVVVMGRRVSVALCFRTWLWVWTSLQHQWGLRGGRTAWTCRYPSSLALLLSGHICGVLRKSCCAHISLWCRNRRNSTDPWAKEQCGQIHLLPVPCCRARETDTPVAWTPRPVLPLLGEIRSFCAVSCLCKAGAIQPVHVNWFWQKL